MESVEDIILRDDRRGISRLRRYLPPDFCRQAAEELLKHGGKTLIATGFYIKSANAFETDGPPGAIMLADALKELGNEPLIVTDKYAAEAIQKSCNHHIHNIRPFPICDEQQSRREVFRLVGNFRPSAAVAIERCGRGADGKYRNMLGDDISEHTAKIDYIFGIENLIKIGVGDGGNEIGMGNVFEEVKHHRVHNEPSIVTVDKLVIASVSNRGAYGIVAYMSKITGIDLFTQTETDIVRKLVENGAVDGITKERVLSVDGFPTRIGDKVIADLKQAVGLTPARAA